MIRGGPIPVYRLANMCIACQNLAARTGQLVTCPHYFVKAACALVQCKDFLNGWQTVLPADSEMVEWVRHDPVRHFSKEERLSEALIRFIFPPGQPCYRESLHKRKLERGGTYAVVRGGRIQEYEFDRLADEWNENAERIKLLRGG